jgi:hypothetical protein
MEANIGNEENRQVQEAEQERIATAKRRRLLKLISVLERKEGFSLRTGNKTDELVENFLDNLSDDIHDMLCDNRINADDYRGLDSERDTEKEVEIAVRFFPEVLSTGEKRDPCDDEVYPIQLLALTRRECSYLGCNVKAVSFVPLLARLAIELGLFEEKYRGGLLCHDIFNDNVLHSITISDQDKTNDREHHAPIDDKYLQVFIQLRKLGLLKKEDIQRYGLLHRLCRYGYFAEKRFRFLVEWDPTLLIQTEEYSQNLPFYCIIDYYSTIQRFLSVFEAGIKYFPNTKGITLLFHKNYEGYTPFQRACVKFGYNKVMEVVDDTLVRYSETPVNVAEALLPAAIDANIHLDCLYFLLRREPDVLQKLLLPLPPTAVAMDSSNNGDGDGDEGNDGDSNVLITGTVHSSKEQKRE